jgi:glycosyltransferase involved in cell wall biosynthesis
MTVASVVFTAHNRRELVLAAVRLAKAQTVPVEIIVCDDASGDGLGEVLADQHPEVRYLRSEESRGPCYHRNRGIAVASHPIVFPLDDDSLLTSPRTIEQTLPEFADPAVGLVAMPFRNILQGDKVLQRREGLSPEVVVAFVACAHGLRRSAVQAVGGYAEEYFYMGEEGDLAVRLIDHGYRVVLGTADPLDHMQPPGRRSYKADYYGRRNDVLFYYLRAPAWVMPARVAKTIVKGLVFGHRRRCLRAAVNGLVDGLRLMAGGRVRRTPVSTAAFAAFMRCKHAGSMPLDAFERQLRFPRRGQTAMPVLNDSRPDLL